MPEMDQMYRCRVYHPKGVIKRLDYPKFEVLSDDFNITMVFGNHCPCPAPGSMIGRIRQIYPDGTSKLVAQKRRHLEPGENVNLRTELEMGPFEMDFKAEVETEDRGITDSREFTVKALHNFVLLATAVVGGVYLVGATQEWW